MGKINRTKTIVDDISFDSKFEANCYILLRDSGIEYSKQVEYILVEPFTYTDIDNKTKKYTSIKYTVDFSIKLDDYILDIEIKGYATDIYKLRKKLFINKYKDTNRHVEIKTISDMEKLINKIKR